MCNGSPQPKPHVDCALASKGWASKAEKAMPRLKSRGAMVDSSFLQSTDRDAPRHGLVAPHRVGKDESTLVLAAPSALMSVKEGRVRPHPWRDAARQRLVRARRDVQRQAGGVG